MWVLVADVAAGDAAVDRGIADAVVNLLAYAAPIGSLDAFADSLARQIDSVDVGSDQLVEDIAALAGTMDVSQLLVTGCSTAAQSSMARTEAEHMAVGKLVD